MVALEDNRYVPLLCASMTLLLGLSRSAVSDQVILDDVIIGGSVCSSSAASCANGENFVGVGSFSYEVKLKDVNPSVGFESTNDTDWVVGNNNGNLEFRNNGAGINNLIKIEDDTGNFGLGTFSPDTSLHVERTTGLSLVTVEMVGNATTGNQAGFVFLNGGPSGPGQHRWDVRAGGVGNLIFNYNSGASEFTYTTGGNLFLTGSVVDGSSRELKEDFQPVDVREVLEGVLNLEITNWKYKRAGERHIGPVAEDFQAIFGLGDGKHISLTDGQGIALAAIQALKAKHDAAITRRDAEMAALRKEQDAALKQKDAEIVALNERLAALERLVLSQRDVTSR